MNHVLVTGGAGYIGSHVVKELIKRNISVSIIDNLSTGNRDAIHSEAQFYEVDLSDTKKVEEIILSNKFDGVLHFAGSIKVPESVENPIKYYINNTLNSLNLINLCLKNSIDRFIFSSTAAVYGVPSEQMATEESDLKPINPYGDSKLMTEKMLRDCSASNENFNYIALRYFNVSGADPEGKIGQAFPEPFHLINICCEAASGKREKAYIFGNDYPTEDGTCVRDYIHVSDLACAHAQALEYLLENNKISHVLNCGYGRGFSVKEVVEAVKEVTGVDFPVIEAKRRLGDPAILISNADKIKDVLGWIPKYNELNYIIQTAYDWEKSEEFKSWKS